MMMKNKYEIGQNYILNLENEPENILNPVTWVPKSLPKEAEVEVSQELRLSLTD